jgi:thioredoxin reductase (NADPH)
VVTGANLIDGAEAGRRQALPLETSWPGVFAIGDVRAGSTSASPQPVGEGAAVLAQIHSLLATD